MSMTITTWSGSRVEVGNNPMKRYQVLLGWLRYIHHGHNPRHILRRLQEYVDSAKADYADNHPELTIPHDTGEIFHVTNAQGQVHSTGTLEQIRNYLNERDGEHRLEQFRHEQEGQNV